MYQHEEHKETIDFGEKKIIQQVKTHELEVLGQVDVSTAMIQTKINTNQFLILLSIATNYHMYS